MRNRIEIQVEDGSTFLDEFSSQPSAGQVLFSADSSNTDTSSTDWGTVFQKSIDGSDHSDSQNKVKRLKVKSSENVIQSGQGLYMSDQIFINDRILSHLDAISKYLDAIENSSVSASALVSKLHAAPRGRKRSMKNADSNLKLSADKSAKYSDVKLPDLKSIRHDKFIQQQVEEHIRQLSDLDKKSTEQKIKSQRGNVDIYVKQHVKWPHEYVLAGNTKDCIAYNQLNITQWMAGFCRIMREENVMSQKIVCLII